ncbi:hypothetical protein [Synechococcus sp. CCY 9618]|uniref:hypothetical protein n=1 Tax=Synechococcus sp. CCY 9618 TaxID=2815602 RepID=UPI001C24DCF8|nr:hypothetical protein [Synechococcus sp. CCY 9618]
MTQAACSLRTLADCSLAIAAYPPFLYDASGGGAVGQLAAVDADGEQALHFDPAGLLIPSLSWRTGRFLGLPIPPGLEIAIIPERLEGSFHATTGAMTLRFDARFRLSALGLYRAPDLLVATTLSTGPVQGRRHRGQGRPLDAAGRMVLVGVAPIAPSGDPLLDRFLGLPDEALARLSCRFTA